MDFNDFIKELSKYNMVNKELNRLYNNDPDYSEIDEDNKNENDR